LQLKFRMTNDKIAFVAARPIATLRHDEALASLFLGDTNNFY
jgi:hypothetical protein